MIGQQIVGKEEAEKIATGVMKILDQIRRGHLEWKDHMVHHDAVMMVMMIVVVRTVDGREMMEGDGLGGMIVVVTEMSVEIEMMITGDVMIVLVTSLRQLKGVVKADLKL